MNPYASPWNKPRTQYINDPHLYTTWAAIQKHLTTTVNVIEQNNMLAVNVGKQRIYLAKRSTKFRLRSHLDWAWYTPKTIAQAINDATIEQYYEFMLCDRRSDPNVWKDQDIEMLFKAFYAARAGRCSEI